MSIDAEIEKLSKLTAGWDTYDGAAIGDGALDTLRGMDISPMSCGGIMVEFWGGSVTIEIFSDGSIMGLSFDPYRK